MGAEIACDVTHEGRTAHGKALLETSELIFRGDGLRLKIPFAQIKNLSADGERLTVTTPDGVTAFAIGAKAAAWAEKIRNPKSLIDKLGVKPGHRVVVLGVCDDGFLRDLGARTGDISTRLRKDADIIFLGAGTIDGLARLGTLRDSIKRDGAIWTVTPKGKGGIKDTDVMAAGKSAGLVDVKVAAFSATHSAAKFVIPRAQR